jgi:GAF domain-containing protein/nitrogen-specific signal transduction histidine kinase
LSDWRRCRSYRMRLGNRRGAALTKPGEAMTATQDETIADLSRANAELRQERDSALAQKAALAEVLDVINRSPGDPAPVFDAILEKAHTLCGAEYGVLLTYDGERFWPAAMHGPAWASAETVREGIRPGFGFGKLVRGERFLHIHDMAELAAQIPDDPLFRALAEVSGIRTQLAVPLRKDDRLLGIITANRREVRPYSDNQIALLESFAAQAVIAMENARLITEQREALEQQTATAEVLQVINASPGDLTPVFDTILDKAHGLCTIALGELELYEDGKFHAVAMRGVSGPFAELLRQPFAPPPDSPPARLLAGERIVQVADLSDMARRRPDDPRAQAGAQCGLRTVLFVPLHKDDALLGYITAYRQEVRPFAEKEIALLENFAAQAVIAMENARLITEQREALEQQTATAEVLQVINTSPGNLAPVFDAMLEKAMRLCGAAFGSFYTYDGEQFVCAAQRGLPGAFAEFRAQTPLKPVPGSQLARSIVNRQTLQVLDLKAGNLYLEGNPFVRAMADLGGVRTIVTVPLCKDEAVLGFLSVYRQEVRAFSDKQIALLQNFAGQAVIAMENARLLGDLRERTGDLQESLEYQTATSDVLKVISQSTFDLPPVLETLLGTAVRICDADLGTIVTREGDTYRVAANYFTTPQYDAFFYRGRSVPVDRGSVIGRTVLEGRTVHVADVLSDPEFTLPTDKIRGGARTVLGVPLLREGVVAGVIILGRKPMKPFTDRQIELVGTFADQAVIAIENTRMITEQREALEQQTATAEVLQVINASPGDLAPVFDAMLERATTLCDASFGILWDFDGEFARAGALHQVPSAYAELCRAPFRPSPGSGPARIMRGEDTFAIADLSEYAPYQAGDTLTQAIVDLAGARSVVIAPLRNEAATLGAITLYRQEVRPFSEKHITLLQNFAAQAVIAMENARLITETREALEQQTATTELLQVINSSPGNLTPVFEAMLAKALDLCGAAFGILLTYDGERFHHAAFRSIPTAYVESMREHPPIYGPQTSPGRLALGEDLVHLFDMTDTDAYRSGDPSRRAIADLAGARTLVAVALRKDSVLLGAIVVFRQEVRPFSDKQVALLENFAAQGVIAMENARLITEQREALEQQTATAEVLQVINASPGNLTPVFDSILEKAHSLCGALYGSLHIADGEVFRAVAVRGMPEAFADLIREGFRPGANHPVRRLLGGAPFVVVLNEVDDPIIESARKLGGMRTALFVPLRKDDVLLGYIVASRPEVRSFSDKQIALLQNFAAQAVIAMENARLITETQEALEQQTATAEVLQVINSSPGNLAPVFDAMLEKAHSLCDITQGSLELYDGERFHAVAVRGLSDAFADMLRQGYPASDNPATRPLIEGARFSHIRDLAETEYSITRSAAELTVARTLLCVPLRRDDTLLGMIASARREVRFFSEKEIALLENFAAQAVIAMESARLLDELRARTDELGQRQAELRVTFENMGDGVAMFDETLRLAAWNRKFQDIFDVPAAILEEHRAYADYIRYLAERGDYGPGTDVEDEVRRITANTGQHLTYERTRPDGRVIEIRSNPVAGGGFVLIFSDITERKRNEAEIRAARDAAEEASRTIEAAFRDLKTAQANLIQAEKMASLGQLTAGIAHEIKNPLNFVNNFAILSVELLTELKETIAKALASLDDKQRGDVEEVVGLLTSNLEKITEHGRRADGIVKSMLEHSRGASGERRTVDLNSLVDEALNLAYHGARAQDQSFNITLERDFGDRMAPIEVNPQDMTRVFLNLFSNGFYAASKRARSEKTDPDFEPVLTVTTRDLGSAIEVRVRDNGTGIPANVRDKLFQPFFTTKPTGEGTGLGLSIAYDIVTQQHSGTITVETDVDAFTEFVIALPRRMFTNEEGRASAH